MRKASARLQVGAGQLALEADRHEDLALADEDPAVVVVDQQPQLVRDRRADLCELVRPVELAAERLEHLQVGDRADVAPAGVVPVRPFGCRLGEEDGVALAAHLGGHHRGLGAGDELARIRGVLRPLGDSDRDRDPAGDPELRAREPLGQPVGERTSLGLVTRRDDHRELLAADPADDIGRTHGCAEMLGQLGQHLVADRVPVDVVHLLEVVDVHHHDADALVLARRVRELADGAARGSTGGCRDR